MNRLLLLAAGSLVVLTGGGLLCGTITSGQNWGDDFAQYIMQAQSLITVQPREFIEANRFTVEQSSRPMSPVVYPWGFPLLLAPVYAAFGLDPMALKAVGVLFYLLFLILLWFGFRNIHPPAWLLCLVSLFALNPVMLRFADNILPDFVFLFLSTCSLLLMGATVVERRCLISRQFDFLLLGIAITLAVLVRTNGILLVITLGVTQCISYLQWQRQRPEAIIDDTQRRVVSVSALKKSQLRQSLVHFIPYFVLIIAYAVSDTFLPGGSSSYLSQLSAASWSSILKNLVVYIVLPSWLFLPVPFYLIFYIFSMIFLPVSVMRRYQREYHIIIYVILTFSLYIVWPYLEGLRYLFPILPFYISFMLTGMAEFQERIAAVSRRSWRFAGFAPIILVICWLGASSARNVYDNLGRNREVADGPFSVTAQELFAFIRDHTAANSTIIFFKPRLLRLMTDRRSIMIDRVEELTRGDYLCLHLVKEPFDQIGNDEIGRLQEAGIAQPVYENREFRLYRLARL